MRTRLVLAAPAILLLMTSYPGRSPSGPEVVGRWTETAWTMPRDQFGKGLVFECGPLDCGKKVVVHVRAKLGFCDCMNGIADDDHLDQISDVDLLGGGKAIGSGQSLRVGAMEGRLRAYAGQNSGLREATLLTIAMRDRCDVIVATATIGGRFSTEQEAAVLSLLSGDKIRDWAERTLGL